MVASRFVLLAAAATASASLTEDAYFAHLLKRQEPGTPAYNCHDNCGQAITISKADTDFCSNDAFLNDYANCLQCSGPDNYNIWRYYGGTLTTAGGSCGLSTTPLTGEQEDVPPAQSASTPSSTPAPEEPSSTPAPTSAEPTTGAPEPTTGAPEPTSGAPESTGGSAAESTAATSAAPEETPSEYPTGSETPEESIASSTAVGPIVTSSPSGYPVPSSNGTASFTSAPPQQTTNAASGLEVSAGMFGAIVMGMMYGLGN